MTTDHPPLHASTTHLGLMTRFRCGRCGQTQPTLGRKLLMWQAARQFLCARCVACRAEKAGRAGRPEAATGR